MINRPKGEEKIRRETPYPGDRISLLEVLSWIPLFRREKIPPLQKNGKKAVAVISPVFFFPTQKGQNFRPDLREACFDKGSSFPQNVFLASGFAAFP